LIGFLPKEKEYVGKYSTKDRLTGMESAVLAYVYMYIVRTYIMRQANHVRAGLSAGWHAGRQAC
jgi:hypothetical protein